MVGMNDDKSVLQKIIQEAFADSKILKVDGSVTNNVGDNYMSTVFRYNVSRLDSNNNIAEHKLLVKKLPSNAGWREAFGCESAFRNEATAYEVVLPVMNRFRGEDNLAFPVCFHASVDYTVLEDLKPLGFKTVNRRLGLDLEHGKLALKELGRFHGTSLAMKYSEPKAFENLLSKVKEIVFIPEKKDSYGQAIVGSITKAALGLKVYQAAGNDSFDGAINKLQDLKKSSFEKMLEIVRHTGPLSVICHGDFYLNNIMFKYKESGEPSEVMMIDLQAFRYASLSLDLLYFFTTSLRPGVVSSHFDQLMEAYHTSLNKQIQRFAPGMPQVSLNEIHDEIKSHSAYGLFMSFLVLPAVTALPGMEIKMEMAEETVSAEESFEKGIDMLSPEYFRRIKQIIKDYEALGYL